MKWNQATSSSKIKFYEQRCVWIEFALPGMPNIFISCTQLTVLKSSGKEASSCFAWQDILHLLWNTDFLYCVRKLYQMNAICTVIPFKFKIHFNILLSLLRLPKWSLSFRFSDKNAVHFLLYLPCAPPISSLNILIIYGNEDKFLSLLCNFFISPCYCLPLESIYFQQYPILRPIQHAYILCLSWPNFRPILVVYFNLYMYKIADG